MGYIRRDDDVDRPRPSKKKFRDGGKTWTNADVQSNPGWQPFGRIERGYILFLLLCPLYMFFFVYRIISYMFHADRTKIRTSSKYRSQWVLPTANYGRKHKGNLYINMKTKRSLYLRHHSISHQSLDSLSSWVHYIIPLRISPAWAKPTLPCSSTLLPRQRSIPTSFLG